MKPTEYSYEDLDAYVRSARALRAHAVRDFFRAIFASETPKTVSGAQAA